MRTLHQHHVAQKGKPSITNPTIKLFDSDTDYRICVPINRDFYIVKNLRRNGDSNVGVCVNCGRIGAKCTCSNTRMNKGEIVTEMLNAMDYEVL